MKRSEAEKILKTRLCGELGIDYPIIQAGMGYLARADLVAAVSNAGALGVIGSTGNLTPSELATEIAKVQAQTDNSFAVNLLFPQYDNSADGLRLKKELREKVDVVISCGVPILSSGLGLPDAEVLSACKSSDTKVMATIGSQRHAVKAQAAGVDVLIAQGWEAGGHNSRIATMALLPQVASVATVPFAAAGGIATGAGLVAALALGASAAYMGTVFAAASEAEAHPNFKQALIEAEGDATVVTRAYSGKPARLLRNSFVKTYESRPEDIAPFPDQWVATEELAIAARVRGDVDAGPAPAGQIAAILRSSESAKQIVERVYTEAILVLTDGLASR